LSSPEYRSPQSALKVRESRTLLLAAVYFKCSQVRDFKTDNIAGYGSQCNANAERCPTVPEPKSTLAIECRRVAIRSLGSHCIVSRIDAQNNSGNFLNVSVAFTYDKSYAEQPAEQWRYVAPVKVGGVAYGDRGDEFVPTRYIKSGYVFTSRGCPRRCWFCSVWKRDPVPRLLPIIDGWNILDDNLLACPRDHVEAVFAMLRRQTRRVEFTGGLELSSTVSSL
jgi:hypothetical protein